MSDLSRGDARITARGFARYDGDRSGVSGAVRSVAWQSVRATIGLGRPARHKIFPVLAVAIAYVPAIVFVGIAVIVPKRILDNGTIADYPGYYGFITAAIMLFAALVAPEVLVGDRRNGMLALYLSTPLNRRTYLAAKALAVIGTLGLVTLGPPLLVLIGYTVENSGPHGFGGWMLVLVRILISAFAVSAALTAVSMGVSCLTDRRAFAATSVVLLVLATPALASALTNAAGWSASWRLIDVFSMPFELVYRIFGQPGNYPALGTTGVVAVNVAWTLSGLAVVVWRYRSLVVAR